MDSEFRFFKKINYKKAFTLIELLVVIAIIGLLASIVIVNVNSTREKARKSAGLRFSQSLYNALGVEAVGVWTFDEGSGNIVSDSSSWGNNGTWQGSGTHWSTADKILGAAAGQFNGSNDFVQVENAPNLNPGISDFTVEFWVKLNTLGFYFILDKQQVANSFTHYIDVNQSTVDVYIRTESSYVAAWVNMGLQANKWYHVAIVVRRKVVGNQSYAYFYKDGSQLGSGVPFTGIGTELANLSSTNPLFIGSARGGNPFLNGFLDEVRLYNTAVSSAEIQKHYAEGLNKHNDLATK